METQQQSPTLVHEVELGQDELAKAIREKPEKVLATILELCDHYKVIASQVLSIPLGTQEGIIKATQLQGEALALQVLLGTFFDKLTEVDEPDENLNPNSERR